MIDRTRYLQMCRACAIIRERDSFGLIAHVPDELRVVYQGTEYYPISYMLSFAPDGTTRHSATVHDLKGNSTVTVRLDELREKLDESLDETNLT